MLRTDAYIALQSVQSQSIFCERVMAMFMSTYKRQRIISLWHDGKSKINAEVRRMVDEKVMAEELQTMLKRTSNNDGSNFELR